MRLLPFPLCQSRNLLTLFLNRNDNKNKSSQPFKELQGVGNGIGNLEDVALIDSLRGSATLAKLTRGNNYVVLKKSKTKSSF